MRVLVKFGLVIPVLCSLCINKVLIIKYFSFRFVVAVRQIVDKILSVKCFTVVHGK